MFWKSIAFLCAAASLLAAIGLTSYQFGGVEQLALPSASLAVMACIGWFVALSFRSRERRLHSES